MEAGISSVAHLLNAIFLLSSLSVAADDIYVGARILHTLALRDQTGQNE